MEKIHVGGHYEPNQAHDNHYCYCHDNAASPQGLNCKAKDGLSANGAYSLQPNQLRIMKSGGKNSKQNDDVRTV